MKFDTMDRKYFFDEYAKIELSAEQSIEYVTYTWYRTYFVDFLSSFGALAISMISATRIIMSIYQGHIKNKSMLKSLYGQSKLSDWLYTTTDNNQYAKKTLKAHVKSRKELDSGFWA